MWKITNVDAIEILDSRGNPTIEVWLDLDSKHKGIASIPSGASTGINEALELRDIDSKRFFGFGMLKALDNIKIEIKNAILGKKFDQISFDNFLIELDGTKNKSRLGGNAILGCSLAFADAAAKTKKQFFYQYVNDFFDDCKIKMPVPMINVINGGCHADNDLVFQEFIIVPIGKNTFQENITMSCEIFYELKRILKKKGYNINVGDEGGFAPDIKETKEAIEIILESINVAGYEIEEDILLALDAAASEFFDIKSKKYNINDLQFNSDQMIKMYQELITKYPIFSIEDPMSELDLDGWRNISRILESKVQLVGDDLFVTNPILFEKYSQENIANAILIKPNQIGTFSETIEVIKMAKKKGYNIIISHRSGETEDTKIADIAVGSGVGQIKCGSLSRTDRLAKYNQLLRIEYQNNFAFSGKEILDFFNKKNS